MGTWSKSLHGHHGGRGIHGPDITVTNLSISLSDGNVIKEALGRGPVTAELERAGRLSSLAWPAWAQSGLFLGSSRLILVDVNGPTQLAPFLRATEVIDHQHPAIRMQALRLAASRPVDTAKRCFEWVRDEMRHVVDFQVDVVSCTASETLATKAGLCYAKSHLLAALLRASGIPAGLAYQRVLDGDRFVLHGLTVVHLPEVGWYRCDPRGNKPGVDAQFTPPIERVAFPAGPEVIDVPGIFADPLPEVVEALRSSRTLSESLAVLPDLVPRAPD